MEEVRPDEVPVVRFYSTFDGDEVIGEVSSILHLHILDNRCRALAI